MQLDSPWSRIALTLCTLALGASALRGSELILQARKQLDEPKPSANGTGVEGDGGEGGSNSTAKASKPKLTGIPQIDYIHDPNLPRELNGYNLSDYPFYNAIPPDIEFECDGLHDGFYASVPHHCQVYHHCLFGIRYDFLCANYTAFDQKTFICHFVSEVDCVNSPKYYKRNEALYKQATSAPIVIPTTKATTPATTEPPPRRSPGKRRRPHYKKRRPAYDYYYDDDGYEDDDEYYDDEPAPPPRKRKQSRNKGGSRRDYDDDEEDSGSSSSGKMTVRPQGAPGSVYDQPRVPPKIRRPVPLNERHKYDYVSTSTEAVSSTTTKAGHSSKTRDDQDDYYEEEAPPRRNKDSGRDSDRRRPTEKKKKRPVRYEEDYYEDEQEDEEEDRPKKKMNRYDDDYPRSRPRDRDRNQRKGYRGDGYRDRPERVGNRKRYQDGSSKRKQERRPVYEDDEEYEYYDDEEDDNVRGRGGSRYDDKRKKPEEDDSRDKRKDRFDDEKVRKGERDNDRRGSTRYDEENRKRPDRGDRRDTRRDDERRKKDDKDDVEDDEDSYRDTKTRDSLFESDKRKKFTKNRQRTETEKPTTTTTTTTTAPTTTTTTRRYEKVKTTPAPLTLEDEYEDEYEYEDEIESQPPVRQETVGKMTEAPTTTTVKKQEFKSRFNPREEVKPTTMSYHRFSTTSKPSTTEVSTSRFSQLESELSKRFRPNPELKSKVNLAINSRSKATESAFLETSSKAYKIESTTLEPIKYSPTVSVRSPVNGFRGQTEAPNYPRGRLPTTTQTRRPDPPRKYESLSPVAKPVDDYDKKLTPESNKELINSNKRPVPVTETNEPFLPNKGYTRSQFKEIRSRPGPEEIYRTEYPTTTINYRRPIKIDEYKFGLAMTTTPRLETTTSIKYIPRTDKRPFQVPTEQAFKRPTVIQPRYPEPEQDPKSRPGTYLVYNQRFKPVTERQQPPPPPPPQFPKQPPKPFEITAPGPSGPSDKENSRPGYRNEYTATAFGIDIGDEEYDVTLNDALQPSTLHPTRSIAGPNFQTRIKTRGYQSAVTHPTFRSNFYSQPQAPQQNQQQYYQTNEGTAQADQPEYEAIVVPAPRFSLNPARLPQPPQSRPRPREWYW